MPTKPSASIAKLGFSGGDSFTLHPTEKVVLVGPNNSGKSQSLREILEICRKARTERTIVVTELELTKNGSEEDLKQFLEEDGEYIEDNYRYKSWQVHSNLLRMWNQPYLQGQLADGFIKTIAANERLSICNQQNSISPGQQKSKPQHILYDDASLMEKISGFFRQAFGQDLMFDFRGGKAIPIHVGTIPTGENLVDRVGDPYVAAVRQNPLLDRQGDGMKSYAGILFEAIVTNLDVTLLDEPEAFLHPPQMRKLGETLATEVKGQLITATHSSDIMRGFLEATRGDVRILRIQRDGDKNMVSEAPPETIKELWQKPVLRYSNALEGIFHEQTIICEDDSDCRLINSIADHIQSASGDSWADTAYVPTGGKYGVPQVASVLRKIGVPTKAVFDIDFLSDKGLVKQTVEAFDGDWNEIEPLWKRVDSAVRSGVRPKTKTEIKEEIKSIITDSAPEDLPKGDIIEAMKQGKPWSQVKQFGDVAIPSGQAQTDYQHLKESLQELGIYLVPVGEIENFCRELGNHGPKFVTKLLSEVDLGDEKLSALRKFVSTVHTGEI